MSDDNYDKDVEMKYVFIFLLTLLASCAPKTVHPKTILDRGTWWAREDKPGQWFVLVGNGSEAEVMAEVCAPRKFICQVDTAGKILRIDRVRK